MKGKIYLWRLCSVNSIGATCSWLRVEILSLSYFHFAHVDAGAKHILNSSYGICLVLSHIDKRPCSGDPLRVHSEHGKALRLFACLFKCEWVDLNAKTPKLIILSFMHIVVLVCHVSRHLQEMIRIRIPLHYPVRINVYRAVYKTFDLFRWTKTRGYIKMSFTLFNWYWIAHVLSLLTRWSCSSNPLYILLCHTYVTKCTPCAFTITHWWSTVYDSQVFSFRISYKAVRKAEQNCISFKNA